MIECPAPGATFDCPHCDSYGQCKLQNPIEECDDYYAEVGDRYTLDDLGRNWW